MCCCVVCGVLVLAPMVTPFGKLSLRIAGARRDGVGEVGELEDELVQLRAAEHPVVVDVDRVELVGAVAPVVRDVARARRRRPASWCCGRSAPTGTAPALRLAVTLPVNRFSRYGVANTPSSVGNSPSVLTAWVVSCWVRSIAKKKCDLVLHDRTAEAAAELVPAVVLLAGAGRCSFSVSVSRVHRLVAEALDEPAAVQIVGAALGDDAHDAAVAAAVLGLEALGLEVEFLDRFERERLQQAADGVVVVVAAVDLVVDVAAGAAVDLRRELRALGRVASGSRGRRPGMVAARLANWRPLSGRLSMRLVDRPRRRPTTRWSRSAASRR